MKIILKKDVPGLGYKGEVHTVKDGYGRNYLLPQRMAVLATAKALKALEEELKQRAHKLAKIKADAEAEAKKYEGVTLTIEAKVSDGQNIYGSVGAAQIAEALGKAGIEVDAKKVLNKGVKALGQYTAQIQLHREIIVEVPFTVVPDAESKEEIAEIAAQKKADKEREAKAAEAVAEEAEVAEVVEEAPVTEETAE